MSPLAVISTAPALPVLKVLAETRRHQLDQIICRYYYSPRPEISLLAPLELTRLEILL